MFEPLVTVVAICHNHENYVIETLMSVINQKYQNIELIIIENCCTDRSREKIEKWVAESGESCKLVCNSESFGSSKNCNIGLKMANGKYVQFMACDDVLTTEKILRQVDFLENNCLVGQVCSNFYSMDGNGKFLGNYFKEDFVFPDDVFSAIVSGYRSYSTIVHAGTVLFRRTVLQEIDGFDEGIMQEDLSLFLKLASSGFVYHFQNEMFYGYRILENSLSRSSEYHVLIQKEAIKVFESYLINAEKAGLTEFQQLSLLYGISGRAASLVHFYINQENRVEALNSISYIASICRRASIPKIVAEDYFYLKLMIFKRFGLESDGLYFLSEILKDRNASFFYRAVTLYNLARIVLMYGHKD